MQTKEDRWSTSDATVHEQAAFVRPEIRDNAASDTVVVEIGLLTGGQDRHYAVGLGTALMRQDVAMEVIGSDEIDGPEFRGNPRVRFRNLHGGQQSAGLVQRISRILVFYARIFRYTVVSKARIFHILWNNKLQVFDRTLLTLFYKAAGKKVALTAHNVNAGRRDKKDSWLNRVTLKCQYKLADHVFVHTKKMKDELVGEFEVKAEKITVIPYGVNNAVPFTELTGAQARERLGIPNDEKVILYFGAIKEYKGLEYLVAAFQQIAPQGNYRLIIAGERKKGHEEYWRSILQSIEADPSRDKILMKIEFIPDAETETYFKAADVAVLAYTEIFQSGILFLAFNYGLPVIATDVGSFSEDIIVGKTGFICRPRNADDLAAKIQSYFQSELYRDLERRRPEIRDYANSRHSWDVVGEMTRDVYLKLLRNTSQVSTF
jgi:glycosyltransferase involved in cell wall biosynthesis